MNYKYIQLPNKTYGDRAFNCSVFFIFKYYPSSLIIKITYNRIKSEMGESANVKNQ